MLKTTQKTKPVSRQTKPKTLNNYKKLDNNANHVEKTHELVKIFPPRENFNHQSPINIDTKAAIYDSSLVFRPFLMRYDLDCCSMLRNTGHTFQVDSYPNHKTLINGGPTEHEYKFLQFHMHWGDALERGSEHLVDGKSYAAEIHFVFFNHELYSIPEEAIQSNMRDGLLVLAKFVKIGQFNPEFDKIAKCLRSIHLKDHFCYVGQIDIRCFLSNNVRDYWTYYGSLTTPPYTECVEWVIFKDPIEISRDQLKQCHELYEVSKEFLCSDKTLIKYNDRPICNLNDRKVRKSFE